MDAARERRIPLGAPLGRADGMLMGAALCGLPVPDLGTLSPLPLVDPVALPPGVEVPVGRREELLNAVAEGEWAGWSPDVLGESGQAALWLRGSTALQTLDAALELASRHTTEGFSPEGLEIAGWPALSEGAAGLLKSGEPAGIQYLSTATLKGWKGDASPGAVGAIVARTMGHGGKATPPEGVEAWADHTADTGGALLYHDQFARVVDATAGVGSNEVPALRRAMAKGEDGPDDGLHTRFVEGCASSGIDEATAGALWEALAAASLMLVSRQTALAWGRVALALVEVKTGHPAAFFAAALGAEWEHRGLAAVKPLAEEARRMSVGLLPPRAGSSQVGPSLEKSETGWAIRWGLAFLPGWGHATAQRFIEARESHNGYATADDLLAGASQLGLSPQQIEALVRSGACDDYGGRDAMLAALPDAIEQARQGQIAKLEVVSERGAGPRMRYARRQWETDNLGVGFTDAHEMDELRRALGAGSDWSGRLTSSARIGPEEAEHSANLVGLLHDVRLVDVGTNGQEPGHQDERMAVAWLEDLDGGLELVAFPPNYKRHAALWAEGNMVIVTARVRRQSDGEGVYLLCEHLAPYRVDVQEQEIDITIQAPRRAATPAADTVPLPEPRTYVANGGSHKLTPVTQATTTTELGGPRPEAQSPKPKVQNAEEPNYELIITLPASPDDHEDIDLMIRLDRLLKAHVGPDTVILRIPYSPETGSYTKAQLPRGVRYNSVLEMEIRDLLGPDALALIKLVG
jgi:hypothetical protein